MYRSVQSSTDSVHSVKPCISGNLSVGSVTLYKSVQHCIGKGWFADASCALESSRVGQVRVAVLSSVNKFR